MSHSKTYVKEDGRELHLYSLENDLPADLPPPKENVEVSHSHMRWHPTRQEWIVYSAARQTRTFKPPAEFCPLCVTKEGAHETEIPFTEFDVAVFENKFPAFRTSSTESPVDNLIKMAPAQGKCEVVVYSSEHESSVGRLPIKKIELLIDAWVHRYEALRGNHNIKFVMPFENRGEEAGVTLHHPHGQIYAYSFLPPVIENAVEAFKKGPIISEIIEERSSDYCVFQDKYMSAFVPPFARYPYEIWISANRKVAGPWDFTQEEKRSYAVMMQKVVNLYDKFFGRICPYYYVMHASPVGEEEIFEFSGQFYPLLRSSDKMKFFAGCEQGSGTILNDVLPENAVQQLKKVEI